jgi:hypothetical protein
MPRSPKGLEAPADVIGDAICRCRVCLLVRLIGVAGKATLGANIDASASAVVR